MLKNTDPRVKLLAALLMTASAMLLTRAGAMSVLAGAALFVSLLLGADLIGFARRLRGLLALLLFTAVMQVVFTRQGEPLLMVHGFVLVYKLGAERGLTAALRFAVLLLAMAVMAAENPRRMIQGLLQLRLPYVFVFMLSSALRFLPFFSDSFADALTAIQLRGLVLKELSLTQKLRLYSHLLFPVVADAVIKAQELASAMELRGFGAYPKRTSLFRLRFRGSDYALLVILPLLFTAVCLTGTQIAF